MTRFVLGALALAVAGAAAGPVRAEVITYQFTGVVDKVTNGGKGAQAITVGDTFTGLLTYDDAVPGVAAAPGVSAYGQADAFIGLSIDKHNNFGLAVPDASFQVLVANNASSGPFQGDQFLVRANSPDMQADGRWKTETIRLDLTSTGNLGAVGSTQLNGLPLDLSQFDAGIVWVLARHGNGSPDVTVEGSLTSLTQVHDTPEPGALVLLGTGLAGVAGYRVARRRRPRSPDTTG